MLTWNIKYTVTCRHSVVTSYLASQESSLFMQLLHWMLLHTLCCEQSALLTTMWNSQYYLSEDWSLTFWDNDEHHLDQALIPSINVVTTYFSNVLFVSIFSKHTSLQHWGEVVCFTTNMWTEENLFLVKRLLTDNWLANSNLHFLCTTSVYTCTFMCS